MKKILIVDDQCELRELVEITLKSEDYQVFQAENGKQAVEIATSEKPNVIVMDIMMPVMDGIEATRIIKSTPETKEYIVLMLTGESKEEDKQKGFAAGVSGYLSKPFSPLELLHKVEEFLQIS